MKKILSLALALCMIFTLLPMPAVGIDNVTDLEAALAAAQDGDTIELDYGIYEVDETLVVNHSITIEGNGAVIKPSALFVAASDGRTPVIQTNTGNVTIEDLTIQGPVASTNYAFRGITANGNITLTGVTIKDIHPAGGINGVQQGVGLMVNTGNARVEGCTFEDINKTFLFFAETGSAANRGHLTLIDSTFITSATSATALNAVQIGYGSAFDGSLTAVISGNTFEGFNYTGAQPTNASAILGYGSSNITIEDNQISDTGNAIALTDCVATVRGNQISDAKNGVLLLGASNAAISGNDFIDNDSDISASGTSTATVNGNYFSGTPATSGVSNDNPSSVPTTITLQELIDAASAVSSMYSLIAGGTYEIDDTLVIPPGMIIEGNGATIKPSANFVGGPAASATGKYLVNAGAGVTLEDLTVQGPFLTSPYGNGIYANGDITLTGVTVKDIHHAANLTGMQVGFGLYVPSGAFDVVVEDCVFENIQKCAILARTGINLILTDSDFIAADFIDSIAQNAIQIGFESGKTSACTATVTGNTFSGFMYTGPQSASSAALLLYGGDNVIISGNTISDTDLAISLADESTATVTNNTFTDVREIYRGTSNSTFSGDFTGDYGQIESTILIDKAKIDDLTINHFNLADSAMLEDGVKLDIVWDIDDLFDAIDNKAVSTVVHWESKITKATDASGFDIDPTGYTAPFVKVILTGSDTPNVATFTQEVRDVTDTVVTEVLNNGVTYTAHIYAEGLPAMSGLNIPLMFDTTRLENITVSAGTGLASLGYELELDLYGSAILSAVATVADEFTGGAVLSKSELFVVTFTVKNAATGNVTIFAENTVPTNTVHGISGFLPTDMVRTEVTAGERFTFKGGIEAPLFEIQKPVTITGVAKLARKDRTVQTDIAYTPRADLDAGIEVKLYAGYTAPTSPGSVTGTLVASGVTRNGGSFELVLANGAVLTAGDYTLEFRRFGVSGSRDEQYLDTIVQITVATGIKGGACIFDDDSAFWLYPLVDTVGALAIGHSVYEDVKTALGEQVEGDLYNQVYDVNEHSGIDIADVAAVKAGGGLTKAIAGGAPRAITPQP